MEGLKAKVDKKRRELADLEEQMQREHERLALDAVRLAFPVDSRFGSDLTQIQIYEYPYLFSIRFNTDTEIFSQRKDCIKLLYVRDFQGELAFGPTFECAVPEWRRENEGECEFLGVKDTDPLSTAIAKVARFWADVETALTIYISQMQNCPDESARPPNVETFANEFAKLKHVD